MDKNWQQQNKQKIKHAWYAFFFKSTLSNKLTDSEK